MESKRETLSQNSQQILNRVAEINNSDNLNAFSYGDLADTMQLLTDKSVVNMPEVRTALAKVKVAINQRLSRIAEGKEPLSVDDLESVNQLLAYSDNSKMVPKVRQALDSIIAEYEEENGLNLDEEVLRKNDATLNQHLSDIDLYYNGELNPNLSDIKSICSRVEVVNGQEVLSASEKNENLSLLFEAAKLDAYRKNVGSIKYLMSNQADQRQMLAETTQEIFMSKLGQVALASEITPPSIEELEDDAKLQAYIERTSKETQEKLKKLVDSKQKIVADVDKIIASCADSDVKTSFFKDRLEERIGNSNLADKLERFQTKAKRLWDKKYDIARNVADSIKDNRVRTVLDTLATIGISVVAAKAAAPIVVGAFVAYGTYTAVGAYWYPFLGEAKRLQRISKENGKKLKFSQAWKLARNNLKGSPEHKRAARWGAVSGFLGCGLGLGALGVGLSSVAAKALSTAGRMAGSTSSQIHNWALAKKAYKENPTPETEARLDSAQVGLGLGLTITALASHASLGNVGPEAFDGIKENINTLTEKIRDWELPSFLTTDNVADTTDITQTVVSDTTYSPVAKPVDTTYSSVAKPVDTTYSPVAVTVETDAPQIGDILSQKDHGNGIVETITLGENGMQYQDVIGLNGGIETSEDVQAFYVRRTANMNQFNYLINMVEAPDGKFMDVNQAVETMKKQIELGFVELPEGLTKEHAIHTAFMHAHYTYIYDENLGRLVNDMSAINALSCPNGEDTVEMFSRLSFKYSTDAGFIGRPVDPDVKLPMQAGTIDVKTPCEPVVNAPTEETNLDIVPVIEPEPIVINEVSVSYAAEPQATVEYPSAYAGKNTYPTNNDAGFQLFMEDRNSDGLTAKEIYAPNDREGYKLTGDNRITLGIDTSEEDIVAYQTQCHFNIRDGYAIAPEGSVNQLAEIMGGKVGEAFSYVDGDKELIKYISKEGTIVTFDPDNNYHATIENAFQGQGVPKDVQEATLQQAIASVNEKSDGEVVLNSYAKPDTPSELTKITTPKGNVYARIPVVTGRGGR